MESAPRKVGPRPFSRLEFVFHLHVSRSLYQFQVHGKKICRAPRRTGVYDQMEQLFTNRKFHFCSHRNFRFLFLNGKRLRGNGLSPPQTQSTSKGRERFPSNRSQCWRGAYHLHKPPGWKSWAKTWNCKIWRGGRTTSYKLKKSIPKSALQTWKTRKMDSPQITAQFSEASQTEMREPFDFPTEIFMPTCGKNFPVSPCKL